MSLTRLFVFDRTSQTVHEVGTNSHDALSVTNGIVEYENMQNGCGSSPDGVGDYVLLESRYGDACAWCRYNCSGCDGFSKFELHPAAQERLMQGYEN